MIQYPLYDVAPHDARITQIEQSIARAHEQRAALMRELICRAGAGIGAMALRVIGTLVGYSAAQQRAVRMSVGH